MLHRFVRASRFDTFCTCSLFIAGIFIFAFGLYMITYASKASSGSWLYALFGAALILGSIRMLFHIAQQLRVTYGLHALELDEDGLIAHWKRGGQTVFPLPDAVGQYEDINEEVRVTLSSGKSVLSFCSSWFENSDQLSNGLRERIRYEDGASQNRNA